MASGYAKGGADLDSIFAAWHTGWPQAAATDFDVADTDLSARYAPLSTGTAAAATIYKIASGADLNTIFAAYGTTSVVVATQPSAVSGASAAGNPSGTVTSNSTSCAGSKGKGNYTYTWHFASGSGVTFTNPSGASTAVTGTVDAASTVSGTMYCTISDGVTSINTNTVAWSLQNTTPAVSVIPYTVDGRAQTPTAAFASILFYSNGAEEYENNATPSGGLIGYWDPEGDGANYDIEATLVSGTSPSGSALNTWISLATTSPVSWSVTNNSGLGNTVSCVLEIHIRLHSTGALIATGNVGLNALSTGTT